MVTNSDPVVDPAPLEAPASSGTCVLYITGSGRSGSTLLERVLGGIPGFVNVGELVDLFRWIAPSDEKCGCGDPFSQCEFWTEVGRLAYGGWTPENVSAIASLQRRVARQRRLPQLLTRPRGRGIGPELAEYQEHYRKLYAAIAEVGGASVVVDASKWPAQGLAVAYSPDLDVRLLHLVRDLRGVAFSSAKSGMARPHATESRPTMDVHPAARTAVRWSACQTEAEIIGRTVPHYQRVRYEDFVGDPAVTVSDALDRLGLPQPASALGHLDGSTVTLGTSHGIGGNPSRFKTGPQELRLDEKWRSSMRPRDRRTATVVGLAGLARYGYLGR